MNLNKPAKIILGILTFLPLIFGIGLFVFAVSQVISVVFSEQPAMPLILLSYLSYVIPYLFLFFLIYLALGIFYLVHIIQNKNLDGEKQFLWIIVLIILHGLSMPIYWYLHVWKESFPANPESDIDFNNPYESGTESRKF